MGLIPNFEYDIFISYAHKDNTTVAEEKEGWVRRFYIDLKDKLIRSTGRSDITIWWDDKKLDGNTYFDQTIKKGLDKAAIIICLHSPSYIQSEWCEKELNHFCDSAESDGIGLMVGDNSRVVHVLLYNLDREDWPDAFSGRTGLDFFDSPDEDLEGDPLATHSEEFQDKMKGLRNVILKLIKGFNKLETNNTETVNKHATEDTGKITVFVGNTPDSLGDRPKRIISELEKKGFNVISNIPLNNTETHYKQVKSVLEKAQLSIHFLDQYPGRSIDEGETHNWFRKKEVEMALESDATQFIWTAADFEFSSIEEDEYRKFLENLEDGTAVKKPYEFVRSVKGNIIKDVIGHADQVKTEQEVSAIKSGPINVLLDNHRNDRDFAFELNNTLSEHNINFFLTPMEDDPKNNNEKLRNYIRKSKKFVFLFGEVENEWLNARLITALKILLDYGHSAKNMIVYMTPPKKESNTIKIKEQGIPIQVINHSEDSMGQEERIKELIKGLKSETNG
ncbi:MAG: toll/interleukin-1 receptor domain-containing protein [Flavobacteriaceae bacterium]|nr:toll/interleukin-1 receptor domain-containing protein [Flavobacteriaceae bacterium]